MIDLREGDCLKVMAKMVRAGVQVDSIVCDPPYHLQSIVKRFAKTGRTESTRTKSGPHQRQAEGFMGKKWDGGDIAFRAATWRLAFKLLKPGGYIVAFGSSRTYGRMSVAMEKAGFINMPMIGWAFGSGFPKAHRVHAEGYEGWLYGAQATKPALEPIYVGQKPMEGTGTENVLKYGTGAINIDDCRIEGEDSWGSSGEAAGGDSISCYGDGLNNSGRSKSDPAGRWPANLIHDGSDEVLACFPDSDGQLAPVGPKNGAKPSVNVYGDYGPRDQCEPRGDSGSAARFFYTAKADAGDRWGSKHPTVKPIDLICYLARMHTPKGGTILDPFAGSGTLGVAALAEGFSAILIEKEEEYIADIRERIAFYEGDGRHSLASKNRNAAPAKQGDNPLLDWITNTDTEQL